MASVAHHLNNSLAVVLGNLEWLAASATLEAHEQRAVRGALEGCYQQKLFIQKLLWASQQGPRDISIERVDEILRQVITQIERLKRPNVTIAVKRIREELAVCVDQAALINTLLGVMLYAQSLLDGQGTITLAAESEHISPGNLENPRAVAGSFVVISIHTTGRALNSVELQDAFKPAPLEDGDVHAVSLALPVAKGVAQAHSGWVTVGSQAGAGTEIKLFLPRVFSQ
jgi:K+-sensing histidine kinase KdpD